jgi:putative NADH-flavin reductase
MPPEEPSPIAVFGATGRTGRLVVAEALRRDLAVVAVVRPGEDELFAGAAVEVRACDLRDRSSIAAAIDGAAAVVSALGPIAGVTTTEISEATAGIVDRMAAEGPSRIVIAANATVFHDREVGGEYANIAAEHRRNLATLAASSLEWTVLAPALLRDDPASGRYDVSVDAAADGRSIARQDFAMAMIDASMQRAWIGHAVGVSS